MPSDSVTTTAKKRSSLLEMVKGRWREFQREPSAFFFVVFMPLLWMAILGFAFSGARQEVYGLGWPAAAASDGEVTKIHAALAANPHIKLHEGDDAALKTALLRGDILLSVVPAAGGQPWVYSYDPGNRDAVRARAVVDDYVQAAAGRKDVLSVQDQTVAVPGTRYIDFLVPGLVALSIMTSSLFGTGAVIVVARREGLLKRYLVTPMRPLNISCRISSGASSFWSSSSSRSSLGAGRCSASR